MDHAVWIPAISAATSVGAMIVMLLSLRHESVTTARGTMREQLQDAERHLAQTKQERDACRDENLRLMRQLTRGDRSDD